jgi:hypothetical protein
MRSKDRHAASRPKLKGHKKTQKERIEQDTACSISGAQARQSNIMKAHCCEKTIQHEGQFEGHANHHIHVQVECLMCTKREKTGDALSKASCSKNKPAHGSPIRLTRRRTHSINPSAVALVPVQ